MSYTNVQVEAESLLPSNGTLTFGSSDSIRVLPANFGGAIPTNGFVRLSVFSNSGDVNGFGFSNTHRGFVEFNIFVQSGAGERRAYQVADALDTLYQGQTEGNSTFFRSTVSAKGIDTDNPQLWRLDYRVPFIRYN